MASHELPLLFLTGMSRSQAFYQPLLDQLPGIRVLDWIEPLRFEPIAEYATRLATQVNREQRPVVVGISFGGIVAQELAPLVNARGLILISTIRSPDQFPLSLRILRLLGQANIQRLLQLLIATARLIPAQLLPKRVRRLRSGAAEDQSWLNWSAAAAVTWRPSNHREPVIPTLQIHGDRDRVFSITQSTADIIITDGEHDLALSHFTELATQISQFIKSLHCDADDYQQALQ